MGIKRLKYLLLVFEEKLKRAHAVISHTLHLNGTSKDEND